MQFASSKNIPAVHLSMMKFGGDEKKFTEEMLQALDEAKTDVIVLAGYMKKLPNEVVEKYDKRIVNIHPALLPRHGGEGMYGLYVHQAVLDARETVTGATAHYVDTVYDSGEIILQEECPVLPNDTPEILQSRVKEIEHSLLPRAIALVIEKMSAK
jgi:phosphoribosylglycinamide formyltransferase-1